MEELAFNLALMACSYVYGFGVIAAGMILQQRLEKEPSFTRKIIHCLAGYSSFVIFWFTPAHAWFAIIIGTSFTILLIFSRSKGPLGAVFQSMARDGDVVTGSLRGPVYYAISLTILSTLFTLPWLPHLLERFWIPACALSMMFTGDGLAPFAGKRCPGRKFGLNGKTAAGTVATFVAGTAGALVALALAILLSTNQVVPGPAWLVIIFITLTAAVNALIEAYSPAGWDNVTCPLASTAILCLLVSVL